MKTIVEIEHKTPAALEAAFYGCYMRTNALNGPVEWDEIQGPNWSVRRAEAAVSREAERAGQKHERLANDSPLAGRSRIPRCSCGWKGDLCQSPEAAQVAFEAHVAAATGAALGEPATIAEASFAADETPLPAVDVRGIEYQPDLHELLAELHTTVGGPRWQSAATRLLAALVERVGR